MIEYDGKRIAKHTPSIHATSTSQFQYPPKDSYVGGGGVVVLSVTVPPHGPSTPLRSTLLALVLLALGVIENLETGRVSTLEGSTGILSFSLDSLTLLETGGVL